MGNNIPGIESITSTSSRSVSINDFNFIKTIEDDRFGSAIKLYKHKEYEQHVAAKSRPIDSEETDKKLTAEILRRGEHKLFHPSISQVLGYSTATPEHLCGSHKLFTIYFEFSTYDLAKEIDERTKFKDFFKEADLWKLLQQIVGACLHLQSFKIAHKDICPRNIFVSWRRDFVLIDDILLEERTSLTHLILGARKEFISPEQMTSISRGEHHPKYDHYKSGVFSLGMSALAAASLLPVTKVYDWTNYKVVPEEIQALLQSIRTRYSPDFCGILAQMLEVDDTKRPSFDRCLQPGRIQPPGYPSQPQQQPPPYPIGNQQQPSHYGPGPQGMQAGPGGLQGMQQDPRMMIAPSQYYSYQPQMNQEKAYSMAPPQGPPTQLQKAPPQRMPQQGQQPLDVTMRNVMPASRVAGQTQIPPQGPPPQLLSQQPQQSQQQGPSMGVYGGPIATAYFPEPSGQQPPQSGPKTPQHQAQAQRDPAKPPYPVFESGQNMAAPPPLQIPQQIPQVRSNNFLAAPGDNMTPTHGGGGGMARSPMHKVEPALKQTNIMGGRPSDSMMHTGYIQQTGIQRPGESGRPVQPLHPAGAGGFYGYGNQHLR